MAIVATHEDRGLLYGYDDETGEWKRIDRQMFEEGASIPGALRNIGRSAAKEGEGLVLGAKQLMGGQAVDERVADYQARREMDQAAAPVANTLGSILPDVAAGGLVGLGTGGMGLVPMLGTEALLGGTMAGMRPGSTEERIQAAAIGAGLGVAIPGAGAAISPIAKRAIARAMPVVDGLRARTSSKTAQVLSEAEIQARRVADDDAAYREMKARAEPGAVGAQRTPDELLDSESRALRQSVDSGSDSEEAIMARAQAHGWEPPMSWGTLKGSPAKSLDAWQESSPLISIANARRMQNNEAVTAQAYAHAIGLSNSPKNGFSKITVDDLAQAEKLLDEHYVELKNNMPKIPLADFKAALEPIKNMDPSAVPKDAERTLREYLDKWDAQGAAKLTPEQYLNRRRDFADLAAKFTRDNDSASADMMHQAVEELEGVIERHLVAQADAAGSNDARKAAKSYLGAYRRLRQRSNLIRMSQSRKMVSDEGHVNAKTVKAVMEKPRRLGGFSRQGPDDTSPLRPLWDLSVAQAAAGSGVPKTGAQLLNAFKRGGLAAGSSALGVGGLEVLF